MMIRMLIFPLWVRFTGTNRVFLCISQSMYLTRRSMERSLHDGDLWRRSGGKPIARRKAAPPSPGVGPASKWSAAFREEVRMKLHNSHLSGGSRPPGPHRSAPPPAKLRSLDVDACRDFWRAEPARYGILRDKYRDLLTSKHIGPTEFRRRVQAVAERYGVSLNHVPSLKTFGRFAKLNDARPLGDLPVALSLVALTMKELPAP